MGEYRHWIDIKTRAFLDLYPDEEWGNAHIVLSDDNYYDQHLDWVLAQELSPAARQYIQWLKSIPEIFRLTFRDCNPEDECSLPDGKLGVDN